MLRLNPRVLACSLAGALLALSACNDSSAPAPAQAPGTTPTPAPTSSPSQATFTEVSALLAANCNACHSGSNPSAGLDFTTYDNVVHNPVQPSLVVPGHPEQSGLFLHANDNASLSGAELQLIHDWIAAGAPNN